MTTTNIVTRTNVTPATTSKTLPAEDIAINVNTTTVDKEKLGQFQSSVIPYIRMSYIDLVAARMRPEKRVHVFFGDNDVSNFLQKANIIEIDGNKKGQLNDIVEGLPDAIFLGNSAAAIFATELDYRNPQDPSTIFTRLYVSDFVADTAVNPGDVIRSSNVNSTFTATINNYTHHAGVVRPNSNSTQIILSLAANSTIDEYYTGNTITIVGGVNAGKRANIISYTAATRTAYIEVSNNTIFKDFYTLPQSPSVEDFLPTYYSLSDYRIVTETVCVLDHYISPGGYFTGRLHIPDPTRYDDTGLLLPAGKNLIRIIDNPGNDTRSYTTRAEYIYTAGDPDVHQTQVSIDTKKLAPSVDQIDLVASTPGTPKLSPLITFNPETCEIVVNPGSDPCKIPANNCYLNVEGGCFKKTSTANGSFDGGMLDIDCIPRWRYTDANGLVIKGFPNRQFSDSSIEFDAVELGVPGAVNYSAVSPNWTAGYHPVTRGHLVSEAADLSTIPLPTGTYLQFWAPETNGWGETQDVSGLYLSDIFCLSSLCQPMMPAPIAQSFYVSAQESRSGIFVSSIDLYFKSTGILPVEVQLRTIENGFPSNMIIPGAVATLESPMINVSNAPDITNSSTATKFTFPSPVYLSPGFEYCFVVQTDDYGYDLFISESGKKNLINGQTISKKKYTGSLFKSYTGNDWYSLDDQDITFIINKCNFAPATGTLYLEENKNSQKSISLSDYPYDSLQMKSDAKEYASTSLKYSYKSRSNTTNELDGVYQTFKPDSTVDMIEKKVLGVSDDKSFIAAIEFSTTNPDVSPVVYTHRQALDLFNNSITPSGIPSDKITVTNEGSGYANNNTFVTIESSVYSVNANAYPVISNGSVIAIVVDNPGRGYFEDAVVKIVGGDNTATAIVNSETDKSGGTASTRYISKTITLLDGFDAGDLRVFIDAIKPLHTDIQVYYKVRNLSDRELIDNRNWIRMKQSTSPYIYSVGRELIEYEYRPSLSANSITYSSSTGTFKTFNQFAIKIVIFSEGTLASQIPYVHDVRAIALPGDAY